MGDRTPIDTRLATLAWNDDDMLEIRFKPDMPLDLSGVRELVEHRLRMTHGIKARVLVVLVADMDFEIQVPTTDHHSPMAASTLAEAVIAPTVMLEKIARMYYRYFPQGYPTEVFTEEVAAVAWLKQHSAT